MPTATDDVGAVGPPRERILACAYDLFSCRGVRDVGVDEIIGRSGVAKATLYHHFPSKDALVEAFLQRREQRWTREFVEAESHRRGSTPDARLLAIFDVFDEWFHREEFEACSFINVLLEMGPHHRLGRVSIGHLENIRGIVGERAREAGLQDPDAFARSWAILMKGSIIAATEGDTDAGKRAQTLGQHLIDLHRPPPPNPR